MDANQKRGCWGCLFFLCLFVFIILLSVFFFAKSNHFAILMLIILVMGTGIASLLQFYENKNDEQEQHKETASYTESTTEGEKPYINHNQVSEKEVGLPKNDSVDSFDEDDFYSDSLYVDVNDLGLADNPEYYIVYIDSNDEPSMRYIILKALTIKKDRVYLNAFCKLRNDDRMFLTDRIKKLKYNDKVIDNPTEYFYRLFTESDFYAVSEFTKQKADVLKLFAFLAKADGKMVKAETNVIVEYIKKYLPQVADTTVEKIAKHIQVVSIAEFNAIIKKFKKETADNADILEFYKKLYELKKEPDPLERGIYEKVMTSLQV